MMAAARRVILFETCYKLDGFRLFNFARRRALKHVI